MEDLVHDFWTTLPRLPESHRPSRRLDYSTIIAAKDTAFLTPFTHTPLERVGIGEIRPFLSEIMFRAVDAVNGGRMPMISGGPYQNCGQSVDSAGDSLFNHNLG